jgi:hypothetical protein
VGWHFRIDEGETPHLSDYVPIMSSLFSSQLENAIPPGSRLVANILLIVCCLVFYDSCSLEKLCLDIRTSGLQYSFFMRFQSYDSLHQILKVDILDQVKCLLAPLRIH